MPLLMLMPWAHPAVDDVDRKYMTLALRLAETALGKTAPNPVVGCVIVKDGEVCSCQLKHQAYCPAALACDTCTHTP